MIIHYGLKNGLQRSYCFNKIIEGGMLSYHADADIIQKYI